MRPRDLDGVSRWFGWSVKMYGHAPIKASCFSCPNPNSLLVPFDSRSQSRRMRTVSSIHPGNGADSLPHQDGGVRVVLLHGRVGALEERPGERKSISPATIARRNASRRLTASQRCPGTSGRKGSAAPSGPWRRRICRTLWIGSGGNRVGKTATGGKMSGGGNWPRWDRVLGVIATRAGGEWKLR